jgi:DNA-binding transcriptional ArsR family regulator
VVLAVGGVATGDGHLSTSLLRFDRGEGTSRDWRAIAAVCHALGSEARLGLLRALETGPRTTGELLAAAGLDRGQLYHQLRDLLLQGLVEQSERGRYAITRGGERVFLLGCLLPGDPKQPPDAAPSLDLGAPDVPLAPSGASGGDWPSWPLVPPAQLPGSRRPGHHPLRGSTVLWSVPDDASGCSAGAAPARRGRRSLESAAGAD